MITRRDAIRLGLALPAMFAGANLAFAGKEFWEEKQPQDWTEDEIDRLLTNSPWAKAATISNNGEYGGFGGRRSGGGLGFPGGGVGFPGGGGGLGYPGGGNRRGGTGPGGGARGGQTGQPRFQATVRWDSALPIQQALHIGPDSKEQNADFEKYYVIHILGDAPMLGSGRRRDRDAEDDPEQLERREEMFKQYTKLERKGDALPLEKMQQGAQTGNLGPGIYFYFLRDVLSLDDKQVTFVTKMGPMEMKCKFNLQDMRYRGKLSL